MLFSAVQNAFSVPPHMCFWFCPKCVLVLSKMRFEHYPKCLYPFNLCLGAFSSEGHTLGHRCSVFLDAVQNAFLVLPKMRFGAVQNAFSCCPKHAKTSLSLQLRWFTKVLQWLCENFGNQSLPACLPCNCGSWLGKWPFICIKIKRTG